MTTCSDCIRPDRDCARCGLRSPQPLNLCDGCEYNGKPILAIEGSHPCMNCFRRKGIPTHTTQH